MAAINEVSFSASPPCKCFVGEVASKTPESPATDSLDTALDITRWYDDELVEAEFCDGGSSTGDKGAPESCEEFLLSK